MISWRDITDEELYFAIYCITALSRNLNMDPSDIYELISEKTNILDEYIIKYYDILHTQGEDYIVSEIVQLLNNNQVCINNQETLEKCLKYIGMIDRNISEEF